MSYRQVRCCFNCIHHIMICDEIFCTLEGPPPPLPKEHEDDFDADVIRVDRVVWEKENSVMPDGICEDYR